MFFVLYGLSDENEIIAPISKTILMEMMGEIV